MIHTGLLMVGILTTGQTSLPDLPDQPSTQPDNRVQNAIAKQDPNTQSVEVTPPEFMVQDGGLQEDSSSLSTEKQNILNNLNNIDQIREKLQKQKSYTLAQAARESSQGVEETITPPVPSSSLQPSTEDTISSPEFSSAEDDPMSHIPSVSQLDDVQPSDWAFGALISLAKRYNCLSQDSNDSAFGSRAMNRYEFALKLNACVEQINELIAKGTGMSVPEADLLQMQRLQTEYQSELQDLVRRIDNLENQTTQFEAQRFSTTTRLFGQAIFSLQATNSADVDLFPRDGEPERTAETEMTFANSVQLSLATSFTGRDLLLTGFAAGNIGSSAPFLFTNMGRLGFELDTDNKVVLNDVSYRFPVTDNFGVVVGAAGVNAITTFRGINPLEGSGDGAVSLLGQRNPILAIGNGVGGIGFDWQVSDRVSLQGVYSAEVPSFPDDINLGGLFGGRYTAGAQVALAPTDNIDVGLHYLFSHSPDGLLGTGIGDSQLISPFAPPTAFNTHAVGATVAWRVNPNLQLGGWGGWTISNPEELSGSVQTTNWVVFAALPDLLSPGNLGGIIVGQPPKIVSSTLPEGFNFPNFSEGGTEGGRDGTSLHVELFYRTQLNPNISLTPGVFVIFNPEHNSANDTLIVGTLRATFRF